MLPLDPDNNVTRDPGAGDSVGGQDRVRAQVQWEVSHNLHDRLQANPGEALPHQLQQEMPHLLQTKCKSRHYMHV